MKKLHITLEENQNIWFTSDLHFGHRNVIRFCQRPYTDEKHMGPCLIENWNNTVNDNDIVFVLGDTFWFNDSRVIKKILTSLKGKTIYILPGNHDDFEHYHRAIEADQRIVLLDDINVLWLDSTINRGWKKKLYEIWLSHYPMMTWPHRENGAFQLFGHIHSQQGKREGVDQDLPLHYNQMDVGCDRWDYRPINFEDVRNIIETKKELV